MDNESGQLQLARHLKHCNAPPRSESLIQDKVKTTNRMHAFLLKFGISVPRGSVVISRLSAIFENSNLPLYISKLLLKTG